MVEGPMYTSRLNVLKTCLLTKENPSSIESINLYLSQLLGMLREDEEIEFREIIESVQRNRDKDRGNELMDRLKDEVDNQLRKYSQNL